MSGLLLRDRLEPAGTMMMGVTGLLLLGRLDSTRVGVMTVLGLRSASLNKSPVHSVTNALVKSCE